MTVRIELPFPPSVNSAYGNNKHGRHKMPAYKAWETLASAKIKDSHRKGYGPYCLSVCLRRPDERRSRDLDNFLKVVSDLLVAHGVVKDDSFAERITLQWDAGMSAECVVLVIPAEEGMAA